MAQVKCRYSKEPNAIATKTIATINQNVYPTISISSGFSSHQGRRPYQEDRPLMYSTKNGIIIGVLDGHAGAWVSQWLSEHFGHLLQVRLLEKSRCLTNSEKVCKELQNGFLQTDAYLYSIRRQYVRDDSGGSTVSGCLYFGSYPELARKLFVFNLGDSRTMVWKLDVEARRMHHVFTTRDHVPKDSVERERILRSGGWILPKEPVYRVNGVLAVSRSMGDFEFKRNGSQQYSGIWVPVSAVPSIEVVDLEPSAQYMVMSATDGLFEFDGIVNYLQTLMQTQTNLDPHFLAESVVSKALSESTDNVSAYISLITVNDS
uniref:protein-serine/threonine phosphatase n=1 Tax=Clandestinovirus TaxID=2831644 RepID=A0A8F8KLM7_9VIRU|nr:serine/threonine phosphatase [Clandestinovirus]